MKTISITNLISEGYIEDRSLLKTFDRHSAPTIQIALIAFFPLCALALIFRPSFPLTALTIGSLALLVSADWLYPLLAKPRSAKGRKVMEKFKSLDPSNGTFLELVFVCHESKVFFRRPVFSNPTIIS